MHSLICGLLTATMVLLPWKDGGGSLKAWMERYEAFLYQQMAENFQREERERNAEICQSPSESEVSIEQTASEEAAERNDLCGEVQEVSVQTGTEGCTDVQRVEAEEPTTVAATEAVPLPAVVQTPLYQVDGYIPDEGLQTYLYQRLCEANIGYFMPYAVCLIAQESTWNPLAENPNGLDKGLLQYRITYWPTLEWWNPYAEIDVFVQQMANRANIGCTVSDMISRHNQSDWGSYCQSYVDAVMAHANTLVQIR